MEPAEGEDLEDEDLDDEDLGGEDLEHEKTLHVAAGQRRRLQTYHYTMQPEFLPTFRDEIRSRAAAFPQYHGMRLYLSCKNVKLMYMERDLRAALLRWRSTWAHAIDDIFIDKDNAHIDVGRQLTSVEQQVFLWRRCCLESIWRSRLSWSLGDVGRQPGNCPGKESGSPGLGRDQHRRPSP